MQSHHRHPELRFFNTLCLPACNRCASLLHLHSKPHHHTSTLHRKRLTEDTKNKRFKHKKKPCNKPNYESAPPFNFPKCNSASHIPTASTKQTLETPSSKKQTNAKQAQIEFKITPTKKQETPRKYNGTGIFFFNSPSPRPTSPSQTRNEAPASRARNQHYCEREEREQTRKMKTDGGRAGTGYRRLQGATSA